MSGSSVQASQQSERTPQQKRRRNASGVWIYINKDSRKCEVESCIKQFSKNTSSTALIYHLHSDHQITVIDENKEDNLSLEDKQSQISDEENEFKGQRKLLSSCKHGTKIQKEIDALVLVIICVASFNASGFLLNIYFFF
jgi:hypothetical protein